METKEKKKLSRKAKNIILIVIICICAAAAVFCWLKYSHAQNEYNVSKEAYDSISEEYVKKNELFISTVSGHSDDMTEKFVEVSPIEVDFEELTAQAKRGEVEGWLYCEDTVINYPVVRCDDNDFYLERLLDGRSNACGTLFIDCRCQAHFSGTNTIIYGHHMQNGSMFFTLKYYRMKDGYYDAHPVLYLNTPYGDYKLLVYSTFITDTQSIAYKPTFENDDEIQEYIDFIQEKNLLKNIDIEVNTETKFVTLSTCSYEFNNARTLVVCVLEPLG